MAALFIASNEGYKVQFVDGQQKTLIEALGNVAHTLITSRFEAVLRIGICPVLLRLDIARVCRSGHSETWNPLDWYTC